MTGAAKLAYNANMVKFCYYRLKLSPYIPWAWLVVIILAGVLMLLPTPAVQAITWSDTVVAEVDDQPIFFSTFAPNLNVGMQLTRRSGVKITKTDYSKIRKKVLEDLIIRKLLEKEAARRGLKVSRGEIERLWDVVRLNPARAGYYRELQRVKAGREVTRGFIAEDLLRLKLKKSIPVVVNEEELQRRYHEKFKDGTTYEAVRPLLHAALTRWYQDQALENLLNRLRRETPVKIHRLY